jgi:ribonuclease HI
MTAVIIKTEAVKQNNIRRERRSQTQLVDREVEFKNWPHQAEDVSITEAKGHEEQTIQAYTDGNKNEQGVGSVLVIFAGKESVAQIQLKLDSSRSNNKAEHLPIVKALEAIEYLAIPDNSPRTATIYSDSRIPLDSLKNGNNHAHLIEEIRKRVSTLERLEWTIEWAKAT